MTSDPKLTSATGSPAMIVYRPHTPQLGRTRIGAGKISFLRPS